MKWLIIAPQEQEKEKDVEMVEKLLTSYKASSMVYFISNDIKVSADPLQKKSCSSHDHADMLNVSNELLEEISHLVIFHFDKISSSPNVTFLLGFCAGQQLPSLITSKISNLNNYQSFPSIQCFTTSQQMCSFLDEHFSEYIAQEKKREAHKKLFQAGIPFTPDCFSFHIAKNNFDECNLFAEAGMDINSRDSAGVPMISMAVRHGRLDMVKWLVDHGADINVIATDRGYTPVMDAVWKSNADLVSFFIDAGAKLDIVSRDGQPVLVLAVGTGNEKICRLLATHGADSELKDAMGMSALAYAKLFKKENLVALFEECVK